MNRKDKDEIIHRYETRLKEYGHDVRTLGSGSDEKQLLRYTALAAIGIRNGETVLDLGCGFGDFHAFLERRDIHVDYTGYDIVPAFIETASKTHPIAKFELRDIQENPPDRRFDWIVSSQAFNNILKYEDNDALVKDVLAAAWQYCERGIAIDMMGDHVDFREERLHYFNPEKMFSYAKTLSKYVALRHDYLPYEFCLYIYRQSPIQPDERV